MKSDVSGRTMEERLVETRCTLSRLTKSNVFIRQCIYKIIDSQDNSLLYKNGNYFNMLVLKHKFVTGVLYLTCADIQVFLLCQLVIIHVFEFFGVFCSNNEAAIFDSNVVTKYGLQRKYSLT